MRHVLVLPLVVACASTPEPVDTSPYSEQAEVIDLGRADGVRTWDSVDDTVMGGVSDSELTWTDTTMVFEGTVSTDSNGGFTSVRSREDLGDLSMFERVVVRLRSEGQPFSVVVADGPLFFQPQFKADLTPPDDGWHVLELPLSAFIEHQFTADGKIEPTGVQMGADALRDPDHLELISRLFEDGPFRLEVDWVAFDYARGR